jgi:hypothetical protein
MGLFNPDKHNARNIRLGVKELSDEERKTTIPTYSNFSSDYNFLTVGDIDKSYGDI